MFCKSKRDLFRSHEAIVSTPAPVALKRKLVDSFSHFLCSEVLDGMCDVVHQSGINKCNSCKQLSGDLVFSVLKIVSQASDAIKSVGKSLASTGFHHAIPCVDTPIVWHDKCIPPSVAKSNSAPVRPFNRRLHFAAMDNLENGPCTKNFEPVNLFGLQVSDDEPSAVHDTVLNSSCLEPDIGDPALLNIAVDVDSCSLVHSPKADVSDGLTNVVPASLKQVCFVKNAGVSSIVRLENSSNVSPDVEFLGQCKVSKKDVSSKQVCLVKNAGVSSVIEVNNHANVSSAAEFLPEGKAPEESNALSRKIDEVYNSKNTFVAKNYDNSHNIEGKTSMVSSPTINRFPVTYVSTCYYRILCGLGYSQWKCDVAVRFAKTTVTYESLGQSIEPGGLCDNFFIAGYCRKLFEDSHPRISRKHYFYPKVGLCFPVHHNNHWFAFIVDLRNKLFVFMDSLFDENPSFQIYVRQRLIKAFKLCFSMYTFAQIDFSDFSVYYPHVPKQSNCHDCGIFCIKFLELRERSTADKSLVNNLYNERIDPSVLD